MATAQLSPPSLSLAYSSAPSVPFAFNSSSRIPALDGLRGIAIFLVLLRHGVFGLESASPFVNKLLSLGQLTWSGVDLFFVLSGFLIGGILLDVRESPHYYTTFYARRAYRILPLYFAITGFFLLRHLPFPGLHDVMGNSSPLAIPWWSYATFTQNLFMVHIGWFGQSAMLVTWSLAVEEQFYLVTPFLIRRVRERYLTWALAGIIVAVPFLRLAIRRGLPHGDFACYVLMPCRADALCVGVLCAALVRRPAFWKQLFERRSVLWSMAGVFTAGIAFIVYQGYGSLCTSLPMTTWGYTWLALFYGCCLLLAVSSNHGVWHSALCHPQLMRLGTLAYCVYLLHFPLNMAGRHIAGFLLPSHPELAFIVGAAGGTALAIALAMLSWRFFERPMLRRGHQYQY